MWSVVFDELYIPVYKNEKAKINSPVCLSVSLAFTFPRATWLTNIKRFPEPAFPGFENWLDKVEQSAKYIPLPNIPGSLRFPPKSSTTIFGNRRPLQEIDRENTKHIDEWMDAWMDEWMDAWMDEWMDGWIDR